MLLKKIKVRGLGVLVFGLLFFISVIVDRALAQGAFPYVRDKATAMALARAQGKGVYMVQGSDTCGNCIYFEESTMMATYPNEPVQDLIKEAFVYWYCDLSVAPGTNTQLSACSSEAKSYIQQTAKYPSYQDGNLTKNYDLPLIVYIDPINPNAYKEDVGVTGLKPMAGGPGSMALYYAVLLPAAHSLGGPIFTNIKDGDVVSSADFQITGKSKWTHAIMQKVGYRLNNGAWMSKVTVSCPGPDAPRGTPKCPATWSIPLSELGPLKGKNTLEVRAEWYSIIKGKDHGVSSFLTFTYK